MQNLFLVDIEDEPDLIES